MHSNNELNPHLIACSEMTMENNPIPGHMFKERIVRWYEFELITEANQGYIINIDHRIHAKKGLLMIRKPGAVVNGVSSYGCLSLAFDSQYDSILEPSYQQPMFQDATVEVLKAMTFKKCPFLDALPESIQLHNFMAIKTLFEEALDLSLRNMGHSSIKNKQLLFSLFSLISDELALQDKEQHRNGHNSYEVITHTKDWIESNYYQAITLQSLADMVGYSKEAFCRLFKKIQNQSPIDYLISIRIFNAKKKLMVTNEPINLIAYECGFKNDTHFYTSFKQREGISPGRYRELHRRS